MIRQCEFQQVWIPELGRHVQKHVYESKEDCMLRFMNDHCKRIRSGHYTMTYERDPEPEPLDHPNEIIPITEPEISELESEPEEELDEEDYEEDNEEDDEEDDEQELDLCFKPEDIHALEALGFPSPSEIINSEDKETMFEKANDLLNHFARKKGAMIANKKTRDLDMLKYIMILLDVYKNIMHPKESTIGGRYKQNRRNAYKMDLVENTVIS